ncbi:MAG: anaerobic ribonucleoside triphosphate reductase [Oscillibacter sp.]|jgi:ribonucleoside-triphosphate reductase|nr:anaerobic ribonucleoside triphosphate reductase [Oscillibacter sp.]
METKKIQKRDGRVVPFEEQKIAAAIAKAFDAAYQPGQEETARHLAAEVSSMLEIEGLDVPDVEHVQDLVEHVLMDSGYERTAKAYILYRSERARARAFSGRLTKAYDSITYASSKASNGKRENANINCDTAMGNMLKYGSEGARAYYEAYVLKPEFAAAHEQGDIHIHDLDFYTFTTTCTQIDLLKLFHSGFTTSLGHLRTPSDIATYSALCCIAIQSNQNDQHGGQSVANFDYAMAEGVGKTFVKRYQVNLARALEIETGSEDLESDIKSIISVIVKENCLTPSLENCDAYLLVERAMLMDQFHLSEEEAVKYQDFAHTRAVRETDRATYQAMEALLHNLNTMQSRAGAQVPFSSLNYGMDTTPEGRMAIRNLLLATEAGLGNGETPIFPIQIFRVKEGVNYNPGDANYDLFQLACRCSAKRLFPNFSFLDAPFNAQYYKPGHPETEIAYMGCRTRVIGNVYDPTREICNQRGNLSFTSINLPRLGIEAHGDLDEFYRSLDRMMDLCIDQLIERMEIQSRRKVRNFPFLMGQGVWLDSEKLKPDDEVREVLKHGTLSIGFIGLAEALVALTGKHHGQSDVSQYLGLEIIARMRSRCDAESKKRKLNFTLLATPAEGLSGRFLKLDQERYGILPGITDREYYTNSFHVPVYFPISAYRKIQLEAPYHALTNAGHISYVELDGDPAQNVEAFEKIIRCMKESGIGYGSINHALDRDPVCGYTGVIGDECPGCGRKETDGSPAFERIRRITGYLVGTMDRWNDAKRAEERDRVKHTLSEN